MLYGNGWTVHHGSCLDVLPLLADNSVDAVVTDPPYELGFMGKSWDSSGIAFDKAVWAECLRVLKPGGHILAFGGSRTWHRIAVAIEDAGFEIRDSIAWLYGSGFPKSLNVSKAIDKTLEVERGKDSDVPVSAEAQQYEGWGTALKPAFEPVIVGRKPLIGTVAQNVLEFGTGGLNIDGTRIGTETIISRGGRSNAVTGDERQGASLGMYGANPPLNTEHTGRWPSNVMLDKFTAEDVGEASRFFYVAKANKRDRNEGLDDLEVKRPDDRTETGMGSFSEKGVQPQRNFHPTVKPTDLMRQLVRLVTPPGGVVLDPFTGSGSTGKAAILEGFEFIGIELTEEYLPIIEGRLVHAVGARAKSLESPALFDLEK